MRWHPTLRGAPVRRRRLALAAVAAGSLVVVGTGAAVTLRAIAAPSNNTAPTISGTAKTGSTLTAGPGTWNGSSPMSFAYRWLICGAAGEACHDIAGATNQTYQLKSEDLGNTARVRVTATNAEGSASAVSGATQRITVGEPVNTSQPTMSGKPATGSTLSANPGTWTGTAPITFQYRWLICGTNGEACHDIAGATSQTYQLKSEDLGNTVRVRVTATNAGGSASETSVPSARIAAGPAASPSTGCPKTAAGAAAVAVADVAAPARLQIDRFQLVSGAITRNMQSFSLRLHVGSTCGQAVNGALVYATAVPYQQVTVPRESATDANGWVTLSFNRLAGFPATSKQQLMVLFVRARQPNGDVLAGISTRRLISLRVDLRR
jgi:hypothetical protein